MAKLLPPSKSSTSSIVKADKFLNFSKPSAKITKTSPISDTVKKIEDKVIKVDKLLKDSLFLSKKEGKKTRIKKEKKEFSEREKELEKKLPKPEKEVKLPSTPKLGFFGWIKNFITQTVLGFLAVRLIDFLPQLLKILPIIINVSDFIIDWGGKLLDGLITFVDWGYKAIDGTRGFIKNIGGEGLAQNFDKFAGAIDNLIEVAVIAALATADSGSGGDLLDLGGDFIRDKLLKKGYQKAAQSAGQQVAGKAGLAKAGGIGAGAVAGIVAGAGLLSSALGEGAFQLRKIATKPLQDKKREFDKLSWFNPKKYFMGAQLAGMSMLLGPISAIGVLLDVIGAPFRYAIELLRFPFLSEEDKKKQAYNLAKLDSRIREDFRKALNLVTLGFAFKEKGSFGNIYGNKDAQKEMMSKMAGGGQSGRKSVRRTLKKKKPKRTVSFIPRKIKPGANTGGEEKVRKVFPNPKKSWWDPFGLFTGKSKEQPQSSKKPTEKLSNPQEFLVKSNDDLGRADFFGPFSTITLKAILGQKPDLLDYKNAGRGLNSWIQTTFKSGFFGFSGGGEVDAQKYFSGEDYTNIIAKTVEDSVSKEVDTTIRNLSKELSLRPVGREEMLEKNNQGGEEGTEGADGFSEGGISGTGFNKGVSIAKKLMVDLGISPAAAAGIVGNLMHESSLDPDNVENNKGFSDGPINNIPSGTQRVGYGWGQWTNDRLERFRKFLKARGADNRPATDDDNYAYLINELTTTEKVKGHWRGYNGQVNIPEDDPKKAAIWFMMAWERPGVPHEDARIDYAKSVYGRIKGLSREQAKVDVEKAGGKILQATDGKMDSGTGGTYGRSARGTKLSGDLGRYIYQTLKSPEDFSRVTQHPDFGGSFRRNYQSWHNVDRAVDIGAFADEQGPILKKIQEFNRLKGVRPVEILHAKNDPKGGHDDHVHVAYARGGETLDGPHIAMIGEEGTEYVIDADSYKETERVAPGLLDILNYDVHDRNSLKKYMPSIINSLTAYMDYEQPYAEPEIIEVPIVIEVPVPLGGGEGGTSITMMHDIDNSVPGMDILDAIG